jgi:glycosyltransferase involved in cell wall biosynthesis
VPGLIAHEWIEARGGSENVLEAIASLYPDADIVTPWNNAPDRFANQEVLELWLSRSPLRGRKAASVPALAYAWRSAVPRDRDYDWIVASSHLFSHHIRARGRSQGAPKFLYVHTPARYIWTPEMDARGEGLIARLAASILRPLDKRRAQEAAAVASVSEFVQKRIAETWDVSSTVIYPPVEVMHLQSVDDWRAKLTSAELEIVSSLPKQFILGASRFVPYKKLDLVVRAGESAGVPVVLAGGGPERDRLRALADEVRVPVVIVDDPSSALLYALYQAASVFVFPPIEDFGIMPVEAMALGTPVVGNWVGGSAETIVEGISGIHFQASTAVEVGEAVSQAMELDPDSCRTESLKFSREVFDTTFRQWMNDSLSDAGMNPPRDASV